jgi:hypothetical protein
MLSKLARPEQINDTSYIEISKKDLTKSKIPELKKYAKELKIKVSGNKGELHTRIKQHIKQMINAVTIQRNVRGHFIRKWIKMKGTRDNCVNDTDFYTLEPLEEIPYLYYIQHTDATHNYGFNIKSLCTLATKNSKFENPYNRENLKSPFGIKMINVIKLTNVLFPGNDLMKEISLLHDGKDTTNILSNLSQQRRVRNNINLHEQAFFTHYQILQQMPFDRRVTDLFMHIDTLGNYTHQDWLMELPTDKLYFLIVKVNQLWHILPDDLRKRICPYMSPFSHGTIGVLPERDLPVQTNREIVIKIAEVLVYSGIDNEHKQLGAMYFLTGLTLVSPNARSQMPWLYDNFFTIIR